MKSFIYNMPVLGKVAKIFQKRNSDLILYGEDNLLPKEAIETVMASGTAMSCVSKISSFIQADGFTDEELNKLPANKRQTFRELLSEISDNFAAFDGCYLNIQYDFKGEVGARYVLPFVEMRIDKSGVAYRKDDWTSDKIDKDKTIIYPAFNPSLTPKEIIEIINTQIAESKDKTQTGFVLFIYNKKVVSDFYPVPDYYSGLEDLESDAALQKLERRNIKKGFRADVIISTLGEIDDTEEDEKDGKTDYERFKENLKKFSGEDSSSILHLYGKNGEAAPTVTPFPTKDILNGIDLARKRVSKAVCRHFNVPPILVIGEENFGWGDTKALVNSMQLFNNSILKTQERISQGLSKIVPKEFKDKTTITTLNIAKFIDPALYQDLTQDERRGIAGYDPLPSVDTTGGESLAQILGTGSTTSLVEIITKPELKDAQKVQALIILFNLTEENANRLVYGQDTVPENAEEELTNGN